MSLFDTLRSPLNPYNSRIESEVNGYTTSMLFNSKDRIEGAPLNNFYMKNTFNNTGYKKFAVKSYQMVNNCYPIIEGYNSKIDYNDGSNTGYCIIPSGNYSASQLASTIANYMSTKMVVSGSTSASALTFTCTYDSAGTTGKLTISAGGTFTLFFGTTASADSMRDIMGFAHTNKIGASVTGDYPVNIRYTEYIDICSKRLSERMQNCINSGYGRGDVIARIPINAFRFQETLYYEVRNLRFVDLDPTESIGNVDFSVYDDQGRLHPGLNNSDFTITLLLYK